MTPMSDEDRKFVEDLKATARRYRAEGRAFGEMGEWAHAALRSWKNLSPRMYARLKRLRVLKLRAMIAEQQYLEVKDQLIRGGMNPWDAGNEASYSLMLAPEDDEEVYDDPIERRIAEAEMLGDLWYQKDLAREKAVASGEDWDEDQWSDWIEDELEKWRENRIRELRERRFRS